MTTYQYPSVTELKEIEADLLPVLTMDDPIFDIMPITTADADRLDWDQEGHTVGLMSVRGVGGEPGNVRAIGANRYEARPGYYGDVTTIDEEELTSRGRLGVWNVAADVTDLIMRRQRQMLTRRINRLRFMGWKFVGTGAYTASNRNGVAHTDTYTLQTYDASTWGTHNTATPLADFRAAKLKSRGHSVMFGASAKAYMNQSTYNDFIANTNSADLAGARTPGFATVLALSELNNVLQREDLPQIEIYDGTYEDDSDVTQLFLPNGVVSIVGRRMGNAPIMDFCYTRNANNPNSAPGPYTFVNDRTQGPAKSVPPSIDIHDGFNGGVRIYFPSAVILMDVS